MRESKKRGIIFIAVAIVLALIAAFLVTSYLSELEDRETPIRAVIVAKTDIPARVRIEPDMLGLARIPARWANESLLSSYSWNESTYARADIEKGDFLRRNDVTTGLEFNDDETAITIAVNEVTGVGGNLRTGDLVNVLVSYVNEETKQAKTIVLLQDKPVLAIGKATASQSQGVSLQSIVGGNSATSDTVTLALTLEEASKLTFMSNFAQEVRLTLRQVGSKPTLVPAVSSEDYD